MNKRASRVGKWGAGAVFLVLLFSCNRSNPLYSGLLPGESCSQVQQCSRGTYSVCQLGNTCRYLASDGTSFSCGSCQSCTGGLLAIGQWCLAGGNTNGGNTNGGNTTGVSTNGGNTNGGNTTGVSTNGGNTNGFTSGGTSGGFTSGTSGGSSGGGTTGTADACTTCENQVVAAGQTCSEPANTCQNDPNCASLITCLQGCADSICEQNCANTAGSPAVTEFNAVGDCICNNCSSSCADQCSSATTSTGGGSATSGGSTGTSGTSGGLIGGLTGGLIGGLTGGIIGGTSGGSSGGSSGGTTGAADVCSNCENDAFSGTCQTVSDACNASTACVTLWNCVNGCSVGDSACITNCKASNSAATLMKYTAVAQCICSTACRPECSTVLPQCS